MQIVADIIVKNEEDYLSYCVKSIQPYIDKIYITDTGSKDKTIDIIKDLQNEYKSQIVFNRFDFNYDYSDIHNFVIEKIKETEKVDYYLRVDADEIFFHSVLSTLKDQLANNSNELAMNMPYIQFHGGHRTLDKKPHNTKPNICKFRNDMKYQGNIHEFIYLDNKHIMQLANKTLEGDFFCHYSWCYMRRRYLKKLERIVSEQKIDSYNNTPTQKEEIKKFYSQFKNEPYFEIKPNYDGPYPEVLKDSWLLKDKEFTIDNTMDSKCVNDNDYCKYQCQVDKWEISCSNYNHRKVNCLWI